MEDEDDSESALMLTNIAEAGAELATIKSEECPSEEGQQGQGQGTAAQQGRVAVSSSRPVSLVPVAGTTFNVITAEQLPHFKPILCVDNGFITSSDHIVIQQGGLAHHQHHEHHEHQHHEHQDHEQEQEHEQDQDQEEMQEEPQPIQPNSASWAETAQMPILPIRYFYFFIYFSKFYSLCNILYD